MNARTGLFTPPGNSRRATAFSLRLRGPAPPRADRPHRGRVVRDRVEAVGQWPGKRGAGQLREPLDLPGCSVVETENDLITHQRDYYDAGEMIYEHLPLLGWAVRGVKRRVKS